MNTSTGSLRQSGEIDDEVADLTEEVILVCVPIVAIVVVWICINDSYACEARSGFQSRRIQSVADKLSVVVLDDRR